MIITDKDSNMELMDLKNKSSMTADRIMDTIRNQRISSAIRVDNSVRIKGNPLR